MRSDFWTRFSFDNLWKRMPAWIRNRYILTLVIFLVWILFIDPNNIISRIRDVHTRNRLLREKEYYTSRIEEDRRKLNELRTSNENLEKFAREQYHMKKPDEDLFIIVTPEQERKIRRDRRVSKIPKPAKKRAPAEKGK